MLRVVIIDYGLGNLGSLKNMCKKIGIEASISDGLSSLENATHLLLPGVGSFDNGIKLLDGKGLRQILNKVVLTDRIPILGICLGAQLMLSASEEGQLPGLGWVDGKAVKFENHADLKVPHMGWNSLSRVAQNTLFLNMPDPPPRFYFVHSYYFSLSSNQDISAECTYGGIFTASFQKNNIYGVQFHPEKSHLFGMQLLENFFSVR